jgi:UDP-glucuronate decarboxylase
MSKKIIVTGGAGFIGSHLVKRLVSEGNQVIVIDNLITTGNWKYLREVDCFKILMDITELKDSERPLFKDVDEIYNLASPASVKLYTKNPLLTYTTSVDGVRNVLELAGKYAKRNFRFLETSTSEAYGDPLVHPQVETYFGNVNTMCERSCYDEGKRGAETLCYIYNKYYGVNTHIVRIFNTYGPNNTDDRVIPTFVSQALKGEDITVFGNGKQTRSFCYVSDTVNGLIKAMASDYHYPINIGNPTEYTILDVAELIKRVTQSNSKIVFKELPEFDPKVRCPDVSLAYEILDWTPTIDFIDGLKEVISWMKHQES